MFRAIYLTTFSLRSSFLFPIASYFIYIYLTAYRKRQIHTPLLAEGIKGN